MDVLVFKTDLTQQHLPLLTHTLAPLGGLLRWSVDWEDCDRVLRVESNDLPSQVVIRELEQLKISCEELT
ncbi:hypothetical protein F5984_07630 [Rudanella paleaurantiibacter]|uniref:Uncharacterized protein n=1 Tax=Rudanella paleaurantiibacter TaxID=2614655 RepID=A0A7J5U4U0_9BACT|nr:hypothetical protein [Rudanella paleaurantiibacter]KAB7732075.1 hypothetical protein F5984_07630 [Rudanella paleaurantiibacter]